MNRSYLFSSCHRLIVLLLAGWALSWTSARADSLEVIDEVEGQPLAANVNRLMQALKFLGTPLSEKTTAALEEAAKKRNPRKLQELLDPYVLLEVRLNPESRVKVKRGPADATIQQAGFVPFLVKVINESTVKKPLVISSPQAGPLYIRDYKLTEKDVKDLSDRFLHLEMFTSPPMTRNLSGLKLEYAIGLAYSREAGKREATIAFDVGQGTQDLGFRGEAPVLFDIKPGIDVTLKVADVDGEPTTGRFTFRDASGRVYPPRAKRLAPDFFFQDQIYRKDGGTVTLPPGELTMQYGRGPEYQLLTKKVTIPEEGSPTIAVELERWINPMEYGFYSGDHHIHSAGCAHYTSPTQGVHAEDMLLHVKGEGLNVGCCLTWGPCFEYQRQFFEPKAHKLSEPFCVLKYDIEVSGFGSQALGHVCLLNLREQYYPGSDGTKTKGWPTWTTPLMRWAKLQGAVTGYAHSASGLQVDAKNATARIFQRYDSNQNQRLEKNEVADALLPGSFAEIDRNNDQVIHQGELIRAHQQAFRQLPNLAVPEMNGIGAQEICVTTARGLCDFISAMDTARTPEWNCWYHIMNCGFPLKASGETDFPCISGSRVGQGRVYVQLGDVDHVDYTAWCEGLRKGRSYVSDGYAHALDFRVNGAAPGFEDVRLDQPGSVQVTAKVAFAKETPLGTADGGQVPQGPTRKVELVVNGEAVASKDVPADDQVHEISFEVPIKQSSWMALRQFPQMHTNPVNVIVDDQPIRASRKSALWCIEVIDQLWRVRETAIIPEEREEAEATFEKAKEIYRKIAQEAPEGS